MIGGEIKTAGEKKERIFNGVHSEKPAFIGRLFFKRTCYEKEHNFNHNGNVMHIDCRPTRSLRNAMGRSAGERTVVEADWLRLHLEVLALRLSYPAYRVSLEIDDVPSVKFTFVVAEEWLNI